MQNSNSIIREQIYNFLPFTSAQQISIICVQVLKFQDIFKPFLTVFHDLPEHFPVSLIFPRIFPS